MRTLQAQLAALDRLTLSPTSDFCGDVIREPDELDTPLGALVMTECLAFRDRYMQMTRAFEAGRLSCDANMSPPPRRRAADLLERVEQYVDPSEQRAYAKLVAAVDQVAESLVRLRHPRSST